MSDKTNVEKWTKEECVKFLRTVKGAKLTGNKCELISRVKVYIQHPDILNSIQTSSEITSQVTRNSCAYSFYIALSCTASIT